MGPWSRIWIFFVIIAVGLVLSWGQIGKKTQQELSDDASNLLRTEQSCQPLTTPCAATGSLVGIVLGPGVPGSLELESTSPTAAIEAVTTNFTSGGPRSLPLKFKQQTRNRWLIALPSEPHSESAELRVWMSSPDVSAVFPVVKRGTTN